MALQESIEKQGIWLFRWRSYLPLIILLAGAFLYARAAMNPDFFIFENPGCQRLYRCFCLLVGFLGLGIRIYAVGHSPKNTSGRNVKAQLADELNTTGAYSLARHPLYLGNFFMWLSPALLTGHIWFIAVFCLVYWIYYERIMFAEEQFLRRKFGEAYTDWAEKVPAFFPRFKNFQKPRYPFSWKKVLKKEKNGLAALFLIFLIFNLFSGWIEKSILNDWYDWLIVVGAGLSLLAYLVLKYLKKRTVVLENR